MLPTQVLLVLLASGGLLAMLVAGFAPVLPYRLLLQLALYVPTMWALDRLADTISPRTSQPHARAIVALILSSGLIALYGAPGEVLLAAQLTAALVFVIDIASAGLCKRDTHALAALASIVVGNVAVWCSNYLALNSVSWRMVDDWFRAADLTLYRLFLGPSASYQGIFPLVDSPEAFWLLQTCYVFFFPQVALATFALSPNRDHLLRYVQRMFFCYGCTLLVFIALPVAGPALAYPASLRPDYLGSETELLMRSVRLEYERVLAGLQPYSGFGSFAAFPSLHTALAVVFQTSYQGKPLLAWALLPINVLLCVATVALGWHYAIDSAAGLVLGLTAVRVFRMEHSR